MKRILCLLITAFLCFWMASCSHTEPRIVKSWNNKKPSGELYISAEIVSDTKISVDSEFEVRIGIGRSVDQYTTAKLEIVGSDLTIISSDGTLFEEVYQIRYNDFDDSKYGLILNKDIEVKYFENLDLSIPEKKKVLKEVLGSKLL